MWLEINRKWRTGFSKRWRMRSGPSSYDRVNTTNLFVFLFTVENTCIYLLTNCMIDLVNMNTKPV
jgi:hypothetical protein